MFPARYWARRYWAARYWPKVGAELPPGYYWNPRYWADRYWPHRYWNKPVGVVPPTPGAVAGVWLRRRRRFRPHTRLLRR